MKRRCFIVGLLLFVFGSFTGAQAAPGDIGGNIQDVVDTKEEQYVFLFPGDLVTLKVYSLTRIAVSDPSVIDVANADVDEIVLIGKKIGDTPIFIWDEFGKRMLLARVVEEDLDLVMVRIQALLDAADIQGVKLGKNNFEGKVVVSGHVDKTDKELLDKILQGFTNRIINYIKPEGNLIQIDVQITELSTTLLKALGFDWSVSPLSYQETLPSFDGSNVENWFKLGDFNRTNFITTAINLLLREGKGRVLSKPSLIVTEGENASFLVGGEIPVRTTTSNNLSGGTQENVSFKSYGVDLTVTPTIKDGKIDMQLSVSIRDIDPGNAVGDDVAFTTRSTNTKVLLDDGQTIILAGLIKHVESEQVRRVPFLSDIPIVGALFRVKENPTATTDQEVVITLTPSIYEQAYPAPGSQPMAAKDQAAPQQEELVIDVKDESPEDPLDEDYGLTRMPADDAAEDDVLARETEPEDLNETSVPAEGEGAEMDAWEKFESAKADLETLSPDEELLMGKPEAPSADKYTDENIISNAITAYIQTVQQKISNAISYPFEAKKQGWEGTVKLTLVILSDGTLTDVSIKESSGHSIFDKDAVNTTKIVSPFNPFPAEVELEEVVVTIPIIYSNDQGDMSGDDMVSTPGSTTLKQSVL